MELATERKCISANEIYNSISQVGMQKKSPFIATVNAVTSRQELRWIIEPVMATESLDQTGEPADTQRGFKTNTQTSDEEEKRRRRRERNKMAAAKCRNRRRELIDLLQKESERLHVEQVVLQKQVNVLQQEKEQLKMLLASHASSCTLDSFGSREILPSRISITIKQEPPDGVSGPGRLLLQQAVVLTEK